MSLASYKKILSVAETILSKIDLPQETFDKYNEFKDRLLEDCGSDPSEIVAELQAELLGVYLQFVRAATDMLGLLREADRDAQAAIEQRLNQFIELFNRKQQLVREAVDSSQQKCSVEGRVVLHRLVDTVEEMELDFDKLVSLIGSTGDIIRDKDSDNIQLQTLVEKLQSELTERNDSLKESALLGKEYKALQTERNDLIGKVEQGENLLLQLKEEMETVQSEFSLKIDSLTQSQRHNQRNMQELERALDRLLGFFTPHMDKEYSDLIRGRNLPAVLDKIEDFVDSITVENKRLSAEMHKKATDLDELQSQSQSLDKKVGSYMADIKHLIAASNECMHEIDNHANSLHRMRMSIAQ